MSKIDSHRMGNDPFEYLIGGLIAVVCLIIIAIVLQIFVIPLQFISFIISLDIPDAFKRFSVEVIIGISLAFLAVVGIIIAKIKRVF
jgi:hypothetical protein